MNTQRTLAPLALLLLSALPLAPIVHAQPSGVPAWTSDPTLLPKLGPPQKFGPITLRLPLGFHAKQKPKTGGPAQPTEYDVLGAPGTPYTNAGMVIVVTTGARIYKPSDADKLLQIITSSYASQHFSGGAPEHGTIQGLRFTRRTFVYGPVADPTHLIHAFAYTHTVGQTGIGIIALNYPPRNPTALALLQASILSLRKTP